MGTPTDVEHDRRKRIKIFHKCQMEQRKARDLLWESFNRTEQYELLLRTPAHKFKNMQGETIGVVLDEFWCGLLGVRERVWLNYRVHLSGRAVLLFDEHNFIGNELFNLPFTKYIDTMMDVGTRIEKKYTVYLWDISVATLEDTN